MKLRALTYLAVLALFPGSLAAQIEATDTFDSEIDGWVAHAGSIQWSAVDSVDGPPSGSLELRPRAFHFGADGTAAYCLPANPEAGSEILLSAHALNLQDRGDFTNGAFLSLHFFADAACANSLGGFASTQTNIAGAWQELRISATVPSGTNAIFAGLNVAATSTDPTLFDNVSLQAAPPPPPVDGDWIALPGDSGIRLKARIGRADEAVPGEPLPDCIESSLCISGLLPGRTELIARVIGPRPNGFLWPVLVKLTPAAMEVWLSKDDTAELRYYSLPAGIDVQDKLIGLFDRRGFLPTQP